MEETHSSVSGSELELSMLERGIAGVDSTVTAAMVAGVEAFMLSLLSMSGLLKGVGCG